MNPHCWSSGTISSIVYFSCLACSKFLLLGSHWILDSWSIWIWASEKAELSWTIIANSEHPERPPLTLCPSLPRGHAPCLLAQVALKGSLPQGSHKAPSAQSPGCPRGPHGAVSVSQALTFSGHRKGLGKPHLLDREILLAKSRGM